MLLIDGPNVDQYTSNQISSLELANWLKETFFSNLNSVSGDDANGNDIPISNTSTQWLNVIDGCLKLVYCTILSDLGQSEQYNMLSSPESGQALITQVRDIWLSQVPSEKRPQGIAAWREFAGNLTEFFYGVDPTAITITDPPLSNSTEFFAWLGWLGANISAPTTPTISTISAQYLCQVPERKGWGSLIVSVLVADIVFLQVLWKLLCWITTFTVERENEQAKYCTGCAKNLQTEDYEMLAPTTSPGAIPPAATASGAKTALLGKTTSVEASDDESQYVRQRSISRKPGPKASPPEP